MLASSLFVRPLFFIAIFLTLVTPALLGNAKLTGQPTCTIGDAVDMKIDGIQNISRENATGTLILEVWAIDAPYQLGVSNNGYKLASYKLDGLNPGGNYNAFTRRFPINRPSVKKTYFIAMLLTEFKQAGYVTVDFRNYQKQLLLGPLPRLQMIAPWHMHPSLEGGTLDITVGKITNNTKGKTGSLRLSVYASKEPYNGSALPASNLGSVTKDGLQGGYSYTNIQNTAKFVPPPDGTYYLTLYLEEYAEDGYTMRAFLPAADVWTFKR